MHTVHAIHHTTNNWATKQMMFQFLLYFLEIASSYITTVGYFQTVHIFPRRQRKKPVKTCTGKFIVQLGTWRVAETREHHFQILLPFLSQICLGNKDNLWFVVWRYFQIVVENTRFNEFAWLEPDAAELAVQLPHQMEYLIFQEIPEGVTK